MNQRTSNDDPQCNRRLETSGEATISGGETLASFPCGECVTVWRFDDADFKFSLTFAVDSSGTIVDPSTADGLAVGRVVAAIRQLPGWRSRLTHQPGGISDRTEQPSAAAIAGSRSSGKRRPSSQLFHIVADTPAWPAASSTERRFLSRCTLIRAPTLPASADSSTGFCGRFILNQASAFGTK